MTAAREPAEFRHWRAIAGWSGVYEMRGSHGRVPLRAVAVRLEARRVCVYSPLPNPSAEALEELASLGEPILVAPNAYHTLGLSAHADRFRDAPLVASDAAFGRIRHKTRLSIQGLRLLEAHLPSHVSLAVLPDVRNGEVWLSVREADRCAWIVGDAFLNLEKLSGVFGVGLRLLRMGPGPSISATFKLLIKDKKSYREWLLARIGEDRPTTLIPCHGRILSDEHLAKRLETLVKRRLG